MKYDIFYSKEYVKDIKKIPKRVEEKGKVSLRELLKNPTKLQRNTKPLVSLQKGVFRIRIGNYRIVYSINHKKKAIYILAFKVRSKIYEP